MEGCVQAEVHSLEKYLNTSKEKILKEVRHSKMIENNKYGRSREEIHKEHREKYDEKPLSEEFKKATEEVRGKRSWYWLKKGYLEKETDITVVAAQDQALCTRNMRNVVYEEIVQSVCRVCGAANKTVVHIVSECSKLAQKEHKQVRHDKVTKILHWKLCKKW